MFYMSFRFCDFWNSLMTMFYIMQGDTMFDTMTGINQVSFFYAIIWSYLWIWFGVNVLMNIALAMVGEGYIDMKEFDKKAWLTG
jgi:multisubunit Na+/H+ antiporter MnhF subunit